jgi:hypothetical protein
MDSPRSSRQSAANRGSGISANKAIERISNPRHASCGAGAAPESEIRSWLTFGVKTEMTDQQKCDSLIAPQIALRFLYSARQRAVSMRQFSPPVNESGAFYRLWDLFCTLRESEVQDLLDPVTRETNARFQARMDALPWRPLAGELAHIKQLDGNEHESLAPIAKELSGQLSRLAWRRMSWGQKCRHLIFRIGHRN